MGIGIGIDKGIGIGKGKGIGTEKGIGIGMAKMLLLRCFLNKIVKSLKKQRVFEGQDDGLRCGRISQPGGDGWEFPDANNVVFTTYAF